MRKVKQRAPSLPVVMGPESLARVEFFGDFSEADRGEILGFSRVRSLAAGELLFSEGSVCEGLHLILAGELKMNKVSADGKEQVIRHLGQQQIIGAAPLFSPAGLYPANAVAIGPTFVLSVPKSRFVAMLKRKPELFLKVLAFVSMHLLELMKLLESVALDKVPRRLAQHLLKLAHGQEGACAGKAVDMRQSQAALAAELGTVREVVSRSLRKFQKDGLIRLKGQRVILLDPAALRLV